MPAHLRPLGRLCCDEPGCERPATCSLFNTYNAAIARYCARHGARALEKLQKSERVAGIPK